MVITLGKGLGVPTLSKLHTQLLFDPTILFVGIYLRDMLTCSGKDLYRNVYSNFMHKTQSEKKTNVHPQEKINHGIVIQCNTTQQ